MACLSTLMLVASWVQAMAFPSVENLRYENEALVWDAVPGAAGYNIYHSAGPSKFGTDLYYLATVKGTNSYSTIQSGFYRVIAFNFEETLYSDSSESEMIWVRSDRVININSNNTVVTRYDFNDRYLVETTCEDAAACAASCETDGNVGSITGGFCHSTSTHVNSSGDALSYRCETPNSAGTIVAGAYCSM